MRASADGGAALPGDTGAVEVARRFRAMNSDVLAIVVAGAGAPDERIAAGALGEAEALFRTVEACASRFRPESELSALNRSAGRLFRASDLLLALVAAALDAAAATDGAFDPTLLDALERAGYDRSFERLAQTDRPRAAPPARPPGASRAPAAWRGIRLDAHAGTIALPVGCRIDLGGIGKGWTVDRAVALLRAQGFRALAVDAGGDLYASGAAAGGAPWTVGVSDPAQPERDVAVLALDGQAVATSTTARRRWPAGGELRHHLIDPRTGRPAASGIASVSVVAETVARAETLAKAALVRGPRAGPALLRRQAVAGLLITDAGGQLRVGRPLFRAPAGA